MSDNQANLTRRTILSAAGAGAAMAFLAACGSTTNNNANTPPSTAAGSATPSNEPTTAAPSPTASASASPSATASSAPAADAVIALDKVPVGGSVAATVDGQPVIVSQPTKGKVACFSAICTHQGATTDPDGAQIHCPRHGSVFDAFTGAVENGPATNPLPAVKVKVDGANVVAG